MIRGSLVVLVVLAVASPAFAQNPTPAADAALAEGRRLYDLQEWDKAIEKFKEAYLLREDAPSLFNIAQSYRLKGDCASAVSFYKTFRRKYPEQNAEKVDRFIVEMEACAAKEPAPVAPVAPVHPEAPTGPTTPEIAPAHERPEVMPAAQPSSNRGMRIGAIAAGGVGVALLVGGAVFGVRASSAAGDAEDGMPGTTWDPSIEDRGESSARNATICFIGAGVAVTTSVVLFVLSGKRTETAPAVGVVPDDGGAQLVWSGRF